MKVYFYISSNGRNPVMEFLKECRVESREEFTAALKLLENGCKLEMPHSRNLASIAKGLHELRIREQNGQLRFLYYIKSGSGIYVLHAFKKKSQSIPLNEIRLVLKRIKEL